MAYKCLHVSQSAKDPGGTLLPPCGAGLKFVTSVSLAPRFPGLLFPSQMGASATSASPMPVLNLAEHVEPREYEIVTKRHMQRVLSERAPKAVADR